MIDDLAVQTAKSWQRLISMRIASGLEEQEYETFLLFTIALAYVATHPDQLGDGVAFDAEDTFRKLESAFDSLDTDAAHEVWANGVDVVLLDALLHKPSFRDPVALEPAVTALRTVIETLRQLSGESLEGLYKEGLSRLAVRVTGQPFRLADDVAILAAESSMGFTEVLEVFTTTAEYAALRGKAPSRRLNIAQISPSDRLAIFAQIRIALLGIPVEIVDRQHDWAGSDLRSCHILIDHPHRRSVSKYPGDWPIWSLDSSIAALERLFRTQVKFGAALVVVPGADRTSTGWRHQLREELVDTKRLIAIIDLPKRTNRGRSGTSAWLIGRSTAGKTGEVLMLDANRLLDRIGSIDAKGMMLLVADVVRAALPERWQGLVGSNEGLGFVEERQTLFRRVFRNGYEDIPALCRISTVKEIRDSDYNLTAIKYLMAGNVSSRHDNFSLLNPTRIHSALNEAGTAGARIYVIGNNGEGKSILLNEVAHDLAKIGKATIGIAFRLTDRFPFRQVQSDQGLFTYLGARTSAGNMSVGRTSSELMRMVIAVHTEQNLLDLFEEIVALLGFGIRRYLVPNDLDPDPEVAKSRYGELIELTADAIENAPVLADVAPSKTTLGLMRRDTTGTITPFEKLSSGEQQLLTLAIKLISHAKSGATVMVDEPETSMHVGWQRAIPSMLDIVGSRSGCSIIVATHSPVIVSSANHPSDRCFVARDGELIELQPSQRRSVETALFDGFSTYTSNNRQVPERCASLVAEVISIVNTPLNDNQDGRRSSMDRINSELEAMKLTVENAVLSRPAHLAEDIDLIEKSLQAIRDIWQSTARSTS